MTRDDREDERVEAAEAAKHLRWMAERTATDWIRKALLDAAAYVERVDDLNDSLQKVRNQHARNVSDGA